MSWPPSLADDLPAPRDDEPASLRQDIADELADHLHCAFSQELHLTRDEERARRNALDRFGDPRQIARKLWFDALQEKIMSQRVLMVALVVVVVGSLASTALTWFLVDQAQQVNQAMLDQSREANAALQVQNREANGALLQQSREVNAALLAKLDAMSTASRAPGEPASAAASLEWNPVKVRLTTGTKGDAAPPAVGYEVRLNGFVLDTAKEVTLTQRTDAQGIANFGLVRPGQHTVFVKSPWGESRLPTTLTIHPGEGRVEEIACPAADCPLADIDFRLEWPDDIKEKNLWALLHFFQEPRVVDGQPWAKNLDMRHHVLAVRANGEIVGIKGLADWILNLVPDPNRQTTHRENIRYRDSSALLQRTDPQNQGGDVVPLVPGFFINTNMGSRMPRPDRLPTASKELATRIEQLDIDEGAFLLFEKQPPPTAPIRWPESSYRLRDLLILGPEGDVPDSDLRRSVVSAGLLAGNAAETIQAMHRNRIRRFGRSALRELPKGLSFARWSDLPATRRQPDELTRETEIEDAKAQPLFTAEADKENHWKIVPPPRLLDLLRANPEVRPEAAEPAAKTGSE